MAWDEDKSRQRLEGSTVVHDVTTATNVLWLDGVVTLPIGAVVELNDPETITRGRGTVVGTRLLPATELLGAQVCIDIEVEDGWWDAVGHPVAPE